MERKELTQRQRWKIVHSDQERERRRLRDKHRRQSMSVEDREKHLARRRRNYQLRRQRDQNPEPELHNDDHTISSSRIQLHPWNENHLPIAVSAQSSVPSDGALHVGCTKRREKLKARKSLGAEDGAQNSANYPKKLRLNDIRHLARSLNSPMKVPHGQSFRIGAADTKDIASTNCLQVGGCGSGRSRKVLRLTHLKRLARALRSTVKENGDQNHLSGTQGISNMDEASL
ncbi:hypothetical protein RHSIM_Rhsim13G0143700 [Rhododendron simsii]|uniref:Uncharacterized protein n=1 Tax=Rhododendron simsii TaxID=118357 RepID=A0A834L8B1_RHOSS|nr:hypothetical protein RHSIM_Rhsim13G0143700 [Rhododendron simsii]